MLKNLASFGAAGAVQTGASRIILDMRPRTMSCPRSFLQTFANAPFTLQNAPPDRSSAYGIDSRRHCMGPSVDLFEPESHIRRLRFTGKCPRLTVEKNLSNSSIAQSRHLEVRQSRPTSCPQKLISHITSMKLTPRNAEKLYSKDTFVSSLLKSKLSHGYTNTATSEKASPEAHKTFSTNMYSRPASKSAERGSLNKCSFQNISKSKRPMSSVPRLFKTDQSSPYLQKSFLNISQNTGKPEEKNLNGYYSPHRRVSSLERKTGEICKVPSSGGTGNVSLSSMKRPRSVNSNNFTKPFCVQQEIRNLSNKISTMSRLQKSNASVVVPCWQSTKSSNIVNRNRLAGASRSDTGTSNRLRSDKSPENYLRSKFSHPSETESSPNVFYKKTIPRYMSKNNVKENNEKSEVITILEPQKNSKSWRGNTKSHTEKQLPNEPYGQQNLGSSNVNSEVARPHTSSKLHVSSRKGTHKLHPCIMDANNQIAMIYKDKFDPAVLDHFRFRNVTATKFSKPSHKSMSPQPFSASRTRTSIARSAPPARKQPFASSAVVKALEIRNNLNFVKKASTLPEGKRESLVVRPMTTNKHAQSTSEWVPFIRPPLVTAKPKADKSFQNPERKENTDKTLNIPAKRPLRQWKEKASKWTDRVARRPYIESRGRLDKFSMNSFKQKASEKLEEATINPTKIDNGEFGNSTGGCKGGRKKITLTGKRSSLRNVASQVLSTWQDFRNKIRSGSKINLRATSSILRIPPMLPDHIRYGTPKED